MRFYIPVGEDTIARSIPQSLRDSTEPMPVPSVAARHLPALRGVTLYKGAKKVSGIYRVRRSDYFTF